MALYKVQIIQGWLDPRKSRTFNLPQFCQFLPLFHYGYSEITIPLMFLKHKGTPWHFSKSAFCFEALKKAFTTAPVLTHWIPDTQIAVETDASDYALAAVLSIMTPKGELNPIAFHSWKFSALEINYNVHDKELLAIFEAFKQWQHYLEGLHFQLMWSPITGICNISQWPKSSCIDKHIGLNIFWIQSHYPLPSWKTQKPNPMHSLDDGMSILKRGIATMSIHRTTTQYSLPRNWHHPSKLLPYQPQSSMDLSSWMLKGSTPTSDINSERILFQQNTLTSVRPWPGPWWSTMELWMHVHSRFQKSLTPCSPYSNNHPLAGHFSQTKTLHQVCMQLLLAWLPSMSKTTVNHVPLVPCQTCVP